MNKQDILQEITDSVHDELQNVGDLINQVASLNVGGAPLDIDSLIQEGLDNAPKRTEIVTTILQNFGSDEEAMKLLMNVLSDTAFQTHEVSLLQYWQKMALFGGSITDDAYDDYVYSLSNAAKNYLDRAPVNDFVQDNELAVNDIEFTADTTPVAPAAPTAPANANVIIAQDQSLPATKDLFKQSDAVHRTPASAYLEQRGVVDDMALANGVAVISGKDWRAAKAPRTAPVLVSNFDYETIQKEGVGRAAYVLVGPTVQDDVRIEIKSQSTPGTAGDKLPTSILRLVNAAKTQSYGSTVVGVIGLDYFTKEALTLAREVAVKSPRVTMVEGLDNLVDVLQQTFTNNKARFALAASIATPAQAPTSNGPTV